MFFKIAFGLVIGEENSIPGRLFFVFCNNYTRSENIVDFTLKNSVYFLSKQSIGISVNPSLGNLSA